MLHSLFFFLLFHFSLVCFGFGFDLACIGLILARCCLPSLFVFFAGVVFAALVVGKVAGKDTTNMANQAG